MEEIKRKKPRRTKEMSPVQLEEMIEETEAWRQAELAKVNERFDRKRQKYEDELKRREEKYADDALNGAVNRMIADGAATCRYDAMKKLAEMA